MLGINSCSGNPQSGSIQVCAIGHILAKSDVNKAFSTCKEPVNLGNDNSKITTRRLQNLYDLSDLERGEVGTVSFIRAELPLLGTIFSMGFVFGAKVAVETKALGVLEVNLGEFNILLGQDMAAKIFLELP